MVRIVVLADDSPLAVDAEGVLLDERVQASDFPDERSASEFIEKLAFAVATQEGDINDR